MKEYQNCNFRADSIARDSVKVSKNFGNNENHGIYTTHTAWDDTRSTKDFLIIHNVTGKTLLKSLQLPLEIAELKRAQDEVHGEGESKAELRSNIATKRSLASGKGNGADEPRLRHTSHHASDTEAKSNDSSERRRKILWLVVVAHGIALETTLEDKVVAKRNTLVNCEPVANEVHEVLENSLEMRVARDGNGDVAAGGNTGPDETRNALGPAAKNLDGQTNRVKVGAVVGDDGKSKEDQAELAKGTEVGDENGTEETTGAGGVVTILVNVVAAIDRSSGHDCNTQKLSEEEGDDETSERPCEDLGTVLGGWLVNSVIGSVTGPASSEAVYCGGKRKAVAHLRSTSLPCEVAEITSVGKDTESDEEDNGGWDPRPEFVNVDNLVAEKSDCESQESNDYHTSKARNIRVDGVDQLGADNGVDRGPTNAGNDVENSDELSSPPSEPESREDHLSQTENGTKGREKAYRQYTDNVEEQADEDGICESKIEERLCQNTNGKGRNNHVGREPLKNVVSHCCAGLDLRAWLSEYEDLPWLRRSTTT